MTVQTTTAPYRVILPASADRAEWLAVRRGGIGSSDVADIMGVGYKTAGHVYYDKRGELPDDDAGEAALWGNLHEETVAREWARRNRSTVRRVGLIARRDHPWKMCTLDRRVAECPLRRDIREQCACEVKTRSAWSAGSWRRDVPDDVLAQVLWQIHVTGYDHIHVACLIGGNDYRQYVVRRQGNEQLIDDIVTVAFRMWLDIQAGRPPATTGEESPDALLDLYGRLHPDREGVADLDGDPAVGLAAYEDLRTYEEQRLREAAARREKKAAKARLVARLGGAAHAALDGDLAYSYEATSRRVCDMERLNERYPDAYADCVTDTTPRRLSIAKAHRLTMEDIDVSA